jgi:hypothetical protein
MLEKIEPKNQDSPVTPSLRTAGRPATDGSFTPGHGGARAGAGRPRGSPNKVTQTFRDVLLQAVTEVGDSQEVGKDGNGGLLGFLKMCSVLERKTTLLLLGRVLPLKITTEVKTIKEKMTIHEAVADLKACGLDPLLALYLQRYPIGPDEEDASWAEGIDTTIDTTLVDVTPKGDTGNDTEK